MSQQDTPKPRASERGASRRAEPPPDEQLERRVVLRKALERQAKRLARKVEALEGDLVEAKRGAEFRRYGEALLAYAHQVPARAASVTLADPADPECTLTIELDPAIAAPANAARYFKRAAKAERAQREVPPRLAEVREEHKTLVASLREVASATSDETEDADEALAAPLLWLERYLAKLTPSTRQAIRAPEPLTRRQLGIDETKSATTGPKSPTTPAPKRTAPDVPAKFVPWRFRSKEGWDVLIGRSSEANDHLTLHMARPEDYWFHAHGCPGSHVVLRRGKGANEPSKATLEEVASWAAFHSKARTAGKVPVIYTQKKYVRKPRGTKAGTVYVEREKMLMVRPVEPPRDQMADAAPE